MIFSDTVDLDAFEGLADKTALTFLREICPAEIYDADETAADGSVLDPADNCYYLYIKVTPNLMAFAHSVDSIADIMPCCVGFDIQAEFEVYHNDHE